MIDEGRDGEAGVSRGELVPVGALLTHVRGHAPVSPSTVSLASGVPATTLRDNIQRLVARRLVRRIPHQTTAGPICSS